MTKITLEYCGMPGTGATVKEAKQDAARQIESLLSDMQAPVFIHWRDDAMLIYRSRHGWEYSCLHGFETQDVHTGRSGGTCCGFTSREDCERSARQHLADIARREGDMEIPAILTDCNLSSAIKRDMAAEYLRRAKQDDQNRRRAHEADAMGLTANDRYAYIMQMPGWETIATPNVAIATNHEAYCMTNHPECGPIHCTC